jgi:hypothetical protein
MIENSQDKMMRESPGRKQEKNAKKGSSRTHKKVKKIKNK